MMTVEFRINNNELEYRCLQVTEEVVSSSPIMNDGYCDGYDYEYGLKSKGYTEWMKVPNLTTESPTT